MCLVICGRSNDKGKVSNVLASVRKNNIKDNIRKQMYIITSPAAMRK